MSAEEWGDFAGQVLFEVGTEVATAGATVALTAVKAADKVVDVAKVANRLDDVTDAAKALDRADDAMDAALALDKIEVPKFEMPVKSEKIPGIKDFNKWFDDLSPEEFEKIWKDESLRNKIESRIRYPGGLHEWLMCSRANVFKKWGVSMDKIKDLRTKIDDVIFKNPPGKHGGPGSTKAHNEILDLIDNSDSYDDFKMKLIDWSEKRLEGGSQRLPNGFFE